MRAITVDSDAQQYKKLQERLKRLENGRSNMASMIDLASGAFPDATIVKDHGPWLVNSGSLATGATSSVNFTHNLNRSGNWSFAVGRMDVSFGFYIAYTIGVINANTCNAAFWNAGPATARCILSITIRTYD